jgi:ribonuclease-3
VFLDSGFDAAVKTIKAAFGSRLHEFPDVEELRDPKSRLQEWLQGRQRGLPTYELIAATGQAHRQKFEIECRVNGVEFSAKGFGTTRRNAEQQAAEAMLQEITIVEQE